MEGRPIAVGFDASRSKAGWGVVALGSLDPLGCGALKHDGDPRAVLDLMRHTIGGFGQPAVFYVEDPFYSTPRSAVPAGRGVEQVVTLGRLLWPTAAHRLITSGEWRARVGMRETGRARYEALKAAAIRLAVTEGFAPGDSDDAAEGALIAIVAAMQHQHRVERTANR